MMPILGDISKVVDWLNQNQGLLTLLLFILTGVFAWFSGVFSALRRKPKFIIRLLDGPTFCCKFPTGEIYNDKYTIHRVGFALYLKVANIGSASSNIDSVSIGYKWSVNLFSFSGIRYRIGSFWLREQAVALEDFHVEIGDSIKVYPFLFQRNSMTSGHNETYLNIGQSVNGVVYFEQSDSWGGCFPISKNGYVKIKIYIQDTFGKNHKSVHKISMLSLTEAKKYNPLFGETLAKMRGEILPRA